MKRLVFGSAVLALLLSVSTVATAATLGSSAATPAYSANQILLSGASAGDGIYWIDPDGGDPSNAFQVYGDMTTAGGGWTLGLNSLQNAPAASTDMVANTGTVGLSSAHTRDLTLLAIDQSAEIRHVLKGTDGTTLFDAYYTGTYHGTMGAAGAWTLLAGSLSVLSYHFGLDWSTLTNDRDNYSGNCASLYGDNPWYYGACFTATPVYPTVSGPFAGSYSVASYSIFVRELDTPVAAVPLPAGLVLLGTALGALGVAGWRRKAIEAERSLGVQAA